MDGCEGVGGVPSRLMKTEAGVAPAGRHADDQDVVRLPSVGEGNEEIALETLDRVWRGRARAADDCRRAAGGG